MSPSTFAGVFPVVAAPFLPTGAVDYDSFHSLVDFQLRAGAHGLTLFGFATEFYKLTDSEKAQMLKVARETVNGRVPVVASVTEQSTDLALGKAREFQENSADALMVLPPSLLPCGEESYVRHVQAVAEVVELPVIVQYAPRETGMALNPFILADLMTSRSNLRCLKVDGTHVGPVITGVLSRVNKPLSILIGYAGLQMPEALARGAYGVMPGSSLTDGYCRIYELYRAGQLGKAYELHNGLIPLLNFIFQSMEMLIKWEKVILERRGVIASAYCRAPAYEPDRTARELFERYYTSWVRTYENWPLEEDS